MRRGLALALAVACAASLFLPRSSPAQPSPPRPLEGNALPDLPRKARGRGVAGIACFRARVDEKGRVRSVDVTRVPGTGVGLEKALRRAVKTWRFSPAMEGGSAVTARYEGHVWFSVRPDDERAVQTILSESTSLMNSPGDGDMETRDLESLQAVNILFAAETETAIVDAAVSSANLCSGERVRFFMKKRRESWSVLWTGAAWDEAPELVFKPPEPSYPEEAKKQGTTGNVVLLVKVRRDGSTEVLDVLQARPHGLTEASLGNAPAWRWKPATKAGVPVEAVGRIIVKFALPYRR